MVYILSIHPCIATNKNGCSECHAGDTELAVAYQQISAHVASDLNHRQAADMAVDAYQELGGVLICSLQNGIKQIRTSLARGETPTGVRIPRSGHSVT